MEIAFSNPTLLLSGPGADSSFKERFAIRSPLSVMRLDIGSASGDGGGAGSQSSETLGREKYSDQKASFCARVTLDCW